jgi:hypothetical protein
MSPKPAPPPERGEISLGDAIVAAAKLGATEPAAVARVLDALGLSITPTPTPPPVGFRRPRRPLTGTPGGGAVVQERDEEEQAAREAIGATVTWVDDDAPAPAWIGDDAVHAVAFGRFRAHVDVEPPLPSGQARAALAVAAATRRPGRRVDVDRLIERAARLRPLIPPPILLEVRTAASIQLLVDAGEAMAPYAEDVTFFVERLLDVAGRDRVSVHRFLGSPLRRLDYNPATGKDAPWRRPPPRSLVVVLSALGAGGPPVDRDRADAGEWLRVAADVAACGAALRVLTPFPAHRWPPGLADVAHISEWETLADLVAHRA